MQDAGVVEGAGHLSQMPAGRDGGCGPSFADAGGERERERYRERERDRQTDRERQTETETDRQTDRGRQTESQRQSDRDRVTDRVTETKRQRDRWGLEATNLQPRRKAAAERASRSRWPLQSAQHVQRL